MRGSRSVCELSGRFRWSTHLTAIPKLLDLLDIRGCLVTIDAMGCQTKIAKKIVDKGGDYLLPVKGNQKKLQSALDHIFSINRLEAKETKLIPHQKKGMVAKKIATVWLQMLVK